MIRILRREASVLILSITHGDAKAQLYLLQEVRCDLGGRGFEVKRLGVGQTYHLHFGVAYQTCDCRGFVAHDHCKHMRCVSALLSQKLL